MTAYAQPSFKACAAKALPLNESPLSAMNKEPFGQFLLSVVTVPQFRNI